jgi:hypothetical protein
MARQRSTNRSNHESGTRPPQRAICVPESADLDHRRGHSRARDVVDSNEVDRVERVGPVLDDVKAPDPAARAPTHDFDRRHGREAVDPVQVGRGAEPGVESGSDERRGHHLLVPRQGRAPDARHARDGFVDEPTEDQISDLAASETECGSLASGEGTVLRGCELSNGAHGVAASQGRGDLPTDRAEVSANRRQFCGRGMPRPVTGISNTRVGLSR